MSQSKNWPQGKIDRTTAGASGGSLKRLGNREISDGQDQGRASGVAIHLHDVLVQLPNGKDLFKISSWQLTRGRHVLVQGPSGCGKTTLLHLIAGLFQPAHGQVRVRDLSLGELSDDARCQLRRHEIGVVFQKLNILEHLTVAENISLALAGNRGKAEGEPGRQAGRDAVADDVVRKSDQDATPDLGGDRPSRIREATRRLNLAGREGERCSHLSLGEQQRVAVARVIAQRPKIILADEPTSSLDAANAEFVIKALKEAAYGRSLVVVSHDQRLERFFDQTFSFAELTR